MPVVPALINTFFFWKSAIARVCVQSLSFPEMSKRNTLCNQTVYQGKCHLCNRTFLTVHHLLNKPLFGQMFSSNCSRPACCRIIRTESWIQLLSAEFDLWFKLNIGHISTVFFSSKADSSTKSERRRSGPRRR